MCSSSGHPSWNRGHQCKSVATVILRVLKKAYQGTQNFVIWIRWRKLPYMPRERLGQQKISSDIFGPWGPLLQSELPIYTMSVEIHTRARVCFYVCVYTSCIYHSNCWFTNKWDDSDKKISVAVSEVRGKQCILIAIQTKMLHTCSMGSYFFYFN